MPAASAQQAKTMSKTQLQIASACDEIKDLLLSKNARYGDSALNPLRVFSQSSSVEQILVRIDDKISRIQRGAGLLGEDEDVINDLIGYLVLLKIALKVKPDNGNYSLNESQNGYWPNDPWDGIDLDNPYDFLDMQSIRFQG